MPSLNEIAQRIYDLNQGAKIKPENYKNIIEIFRNEIDEKFTIGDITANSYLVSNILRALYKTDKYDKGINFIDNYLKVKLSSLKNDFASRTYGWCVYKSMKEKYKEDENWDDSEFDTTDENEDVNNNDINSYYDKIKLIFSILDIHNEKNYLVLKMLLFSFTKIISKKAKNQWIIGLELLSSIDVAALSKATSSMEFKGKTKELASDYENWHAQKAKALFELGKYEECITFSSDVIKSNILKHYDYDIWFKRRIALCNYHLGKFDEALNGLIQVIKLKKDWFIQKDIAEAYFSVKKYDLALKYAIDATLSRGELKFKWELYYFLFQVLLSIGEEDSAILHLKMATAIKNHEKWKLGEKLTSSLSENHVSADTLDFESIKKELTKYAQSKLEVGTIQNLNHDAKNGKIASNGAGIFFRFNVVDGNPRNLKNDMKVIFSKDVSYDRTRKQNSLAAVYVQQIN